MHTVRRPLCAGPGRSASQEYDLNRKTRVFPYAGACRFGRMNQVVDTSWQIPLNDKVIYSAGGDCRQRVEAASCMPDCEAESCLNGGGDPFQNSHSRLDVRKISLMVTIITMVRCKIDLQSHFC